MMEQRSSQLLSETSTLSLSTVEGTERLVLTMDAMIEWQRAEALGWWEHTADWDLEINVFLNDGTRHDFLGTPGFHLEIDGQVFMPWDLLMKATEIPIHDLDPSKLPNRVNFHITDAWVYGEDDDEGHEMSTSFNLHDIHSIIHDR